MIDIELLRDEQTRPRVTEQLGKRGVHPEEVESLVAVDARWRELLAEVEGLRAKKNEANEAMKTAQGDERERIIASMQEVGAREKEVEEQLQTTTKQREQGWRALPNVPLAEVPAGGEDDFTLVAEGEAKPSTSARDYLEAWPESIDTERAAKVAGSRFVYLKGDVARLQWGLMMMAVDRATQAGCTPVAPPVLVREEPMAGMGYLDHEGDEIYRTQDDLYLVGTSEQALGPMHMQEILDASQAPYRYVAYSPCFRREAGSHGKDVRGILRLHQFDKVEMFSFTTSGSSEQEHEWLLEQQRGIMDALQLPYRVVLLAAGDLGGPSAKTYDIEAWIPSEGRYRETHSTSNTTDFQARRLQIRMKNEAGETEPAHMLNGTAVALSRLLIALLENHQQEDGSVVIPNALREYVPFDRIAPDA